MQIKGGATLWARQTIDSDIFYKKPDKWFKIWFYLVSKANHKDNKHFNRGSCFLKYEWIMENTRATRSEVDHCIRYLKSATMIATQKATRGFNLTILNYCTFQDMASYKSDNKSDTIGETKAKQKRNKSDTINNNDKNDKNDKKNFLSDSTEIRLSELLFSLILQNNPKAKKPNIQKWAKDINAAIRIDKRTPTEIERVIRWTQADSFEKTNVLSPGKLRKRFDQLWLKSRQREKKEKTLTDYGITYR